MRSLPKNNTTISKPNKKFSSCFRPVVDIDDVLDSKSPVDRSPSFRFACVPLPHKHHNDVSHPRYPEDPIVHRHPPKRTLSLIIKTVVFETILNRRAKRSYSAISKSSSSSAGDDKIVLRQPSVDSKTTAESPSSSSSSQGSASSCSSPVLESEESPKSESNKAKQRERRRRGKSEKEKKLESVGIYLFLVSLTFTVLWDKYWGVILTLTWLCLCCVWEAKHQKPKEVHNAKLSRTERRRE